MKLGKLPAKHDERNLRLASFIDPDQIAAALPEAPTRASWLNPGTRFGMLGNDQLGDCTIAAKHHIAQVQSLASGAADYEPAMQTVLDEYWRLSGGEGPAPTTTTDRRWWPVDQGLYLLDVLNDWRHQGGIVAFVQVDHESHLELSLAEWLFGGVYWGVGLPDGLGRGLQRIGFDPRQPWSLRFVEENGDPEPYSWGGHAVDAHAYTPTRSRFVSWGQVYTMTEAFRREYADEAYAVIGSSWVGEGYDAPSGFDLPGLLDAVAQIDADQRP